MRGEERHMPQQQEMLNAGPNMRFCFHQQARGEAADHEAEAQDLREELESVQVCDLSPSLSLLLPSYQTRVSVGGFEAP